MGEQVVFFNKTTPLLVLMILIILLHALENHTSSMSCLCLLNIALDLQVKILIVQVLSYALQPGNVLI